MFLRSPVFLSVCTQIEASTTVVSWRRRGRSQIQCPKHTDIAKTRLEEMTLHLLDTLILFPDILFYLISLCLL